MVVAAVRGARPGLLHHAAGAPLDYDGGRRLLQLRVPALAPAALPLPPPPRRAR